METSASYWESKIKIYGFQEIQDALWVELAMAPNQMGRWSRCLRELDDKGVQFNLTLIQREDHKNLQVCIVSHRQWGPAIEEQIQKEIQPDAGESYRVRFPVELIYFQGPHFGDRYGIVDAAFRVLADNHIPILASGCSGAVIYIVLPEKSVEKARHFLATVFEVPKTVQLPVHQSGMAI